MPKVSGKNSGRMWSNDCKPVRTAFDDLPTPTPEK